MPPFSTQPGLLFVAATLLPLASAVLLFLVGCLRGLARPRESDPGLPALYRLLGGNIPSRLGAYLATAAIAGSCVLSVVGFVRFLNEAPASEHSHGHGHGHAHGKAEKHDEPGEDHHHHRAGREPTPWSGSIPWARVGPLGLPADADSDTITEALHGPAVVLELGYRVDHLTATLFVMITLIATLIHVFSLGYMRDETQPEMEDHEAHVRRPGRYGRFFLFLSLFCFSMLNLVIADNLFQVFVGWELVGLCSFLLIGFYFERPAAAVAANKAFIVNRVGDVGFLVGLMIVWTFFGTFNFEDIFAKVRCPDGDSHGTPPKQELIGTLVRGEPRPGGEAADVRPDGAFVLLFPGHWHANDLSRVRKDREYPTVGARLAPEDDQDFGLMPYWLLTVAGLGIFLGCVGKSAQFPLHVWLPDAMEGPTPVSALIHAATMVAAGVYLVARAFPLFTAEVLLVIAYTGAITLFIAATIALVQTDIKRVLAYSTVSQLGYMMLALGVGGWAEGQFHLVTHAFFKALLFLAAGSVILGCHHEQNLLKMGGLFRKMPITALTMLAGVLAIAGTPLFSGWYSKDAIVAVVLGYASVNPQHGILPVLAAGGGAMTSFYMLRLWLLAFLGPARDAHVHDHAHESPVVMTLPLVVLALFSISVAWGWPIWDAEESALLHVLEHAEPAAVEASFGPVHAAAHDWHFTGGLLALAMSALGAGLALAVYGFRLVDPAKAKAAFGPVATFLERKWYFDELYRVLYMWPTVYLAAAARGLDKWSPDATVIGQPAAQAGEERSPLRTVDGLVVAFGQKIYEAGLDARRVQTGSLRQYAVFLALTVIALFAIVSYLAQRSVAI